MYARHESSNFPNSVHLDTYMRAPAFQVREMHPAETNGSHNITHMHQSNHYQSTYNKFNHNNFQPTAQPNTYLANLNNFNPINSQTPYMETQVVNLHPLQYTHQQHDNYNTSNYLTITSQKQQLQQIPEEIATSQEQQLRQDDIDEEDPLPIDVVISTNNVSLTHDGKTMINNITESILRSQRQTRLRRSMHVSSDSDGDDYGDDCVWVVTVEKGENGGNKLVFGVCDEIELKCNGYKHKLEIDNNYKHLSDNTYTNTIANCDPNVNNVDNCDHTNNIDGNDNNNNNNSNNINNYNNYNLQVIFDDDQNLNKNDHESISSSEISKNGENGDDCNIETKRDSSCNHVKIQHNRKCSRRNDYVFNVVFKELSKDNIEETKKLKNEIDYYSIETYTPQCICEKIVTQDKVFKLLQRNMIVIGDDNLNKDEKDKTFKRKSKIRKIVTNNEEMHMLHSCLVVLNNLPTTTAFEDVPLCDIITVIYNIFQDLVNFVNHDNVEKRLQLINHGIGCLKMVSRMTQLCSKFYHAGIGKALKEVLLHGELILILNESAAKDILSGTFQVINNLCQQIDNAYGIIQDLFTINVQKQLLGDGDDVDDGDGDGGYICREFDVELYKSVIKVMKMTGIMQQHEKERVELFFKILNYMLICLDNDDEPSIKMIKNGVIEDIQTALSANVGMPNYFYVQRQFMEFLSQFTVCCDNVVTMIQKDIIQDICDVMNLCAIDHKNDNPS